MCNEIARADALMESISVATSVIDGLTADYTAAVERIRAEYEGKITPWRAELAADEKDLNKLMKGAKKILFADGDVLKLASGSLIRNCEDKVSIPRDALAKCEDQGFTDVIKIAKSLDRDAVEKWPDAKLLLIGAERKPKEEFSYDLKALNTTKDSATIKQE